MLNESVRNHDPQALRPASVLKALDYPGGADFNGFVAFLGCLRFLLNSKG